MSVAENFELLKAENGQWYWRFQAANNKYIAMSSEQYHNRTDCVNSIRLLKRTASEAPVYEWNGSEWKPVLI